MMYWFDTVKRHIQQHYPDKTTIKVLEIGVYHAANTKRLLEGLPFIELTSIDPAKHINVTTLQEEHPDRFTFIQNFSLNVLPDLTDFDVVLIDGDHNRYTVYNELKTIHQTYDKFPLVILHDTNKPWGREDFTYNPSTIPEGMFGRQRQGVLSGVEDFVDEFTLETDPPVWFRLTLYQYGPGLGVLEQMEGNI